MKKEPETYEELLRQKRCFDLLKYYPLTEEELEKIYEFLKNNPNGTVNGGKTYISLKNGTDNIETFNVSLITTTIDGLVLTNVGLKVIPHYVATSSIGGSSWSSSGGGSSNNNNNNNNNNNR